MRYGVAGGGAGIAAYPRVQLPAKGIIFEVDSCKSANFNRPKVTVIPAGAYYGKLGYIDREDLLI
jgi:hypothetical protein